MKIRKAKWEEHKRVCEVARLSKFTKGFASGGLRFVDSYYQRGEVLVAEAHGRLLGFACVRHCVRRPYTSVYYIGATENGRGVGRALLRQVLKESPHTCIQLISEKENKQGLGFYRHIGFTIQGEGANRAGVPYWRLVFQGRALCNS